MNTADKRCTICHIGTRQERRTTYADWFNGYLVLMPNASIWVCDVCGDIMYDEYMITHLEMLLGIESVPSEANEEQSPTREPNALSVVHRRWST